eukprot:349719-Chlamydomonas_euryale.AAC.7
MKQHSTRITNSAVVNGPILSSCRRPTPWLYACSCAWTGSLPLACPCARPSLVCRAAAFAVRDNATTRSHAACHMEPGVGVRQQRRQRGGPPRAVAHAEGDRNAHTGVVMTQRDARSARLPARTQRRGYCDAQPCAARAGRGPSDGLAGGWRAPGFRADAHGLALTRGHADRSATTQEAAV